MELRSRSAPATPTGKRTKKDPKENRSEKKKILVSHLLEKHQQQDEEEIQFDDGLIDQEMEKENRNEGGSDLYSLSRKRDRLEKFLSDNLQTPMKPKLMTPSKTPAAERHQKRLRATRELNKVMKDEGSTDESSASEEEVVEDHAFAELHCSKRQTSNNTLSSLPVLSKEDFNKALSGWKPNHEISVLQERYKQYYPQWIFELEQGFNIVLYGYGSKRHLMTDFIQKELNFMPVIVVHGYFPSMNIKTILQTILIDLFDHKGAMGSHSDQIQLIRQYLDEKPSFEFCLAIHSIDGPTLRNEKTQTLLSELASLPQVHLICSIDHINASLLWDATKTARYNFVWHDATTLESYLIETSFENRMIKGGQKVSTSAGAMFVLNTLNENSRRVFKLLLTFQLGQHQDEELGLSHAQYFRMANEQFLASSEVAFKTQLTEFRDHHLIVAKRGADQTELLSIPFSRDILNDLLEQLQ